MPNELHIRDGGVFRQATEVHIRDAGTWRDCIEVWKYESGTWRLAYNKERIGGDWDGSGITIYDSRPNDSTPNPRSRIEFASDGTYQEIMEIGGSTTFDWASNAPDTTGSDWWIKWDYVSGTSPTTSSGFIEDTYIQLSAVRWLEVTDPTYQNGAVTGIVNVSIAEDNIGTGAVTAQVELTAEKGFA